MMTLKFATSALLGMAMVAYATPNLVTNGGFETGDFTGWAVMAAAGTGCSDFGVTNNPAEANSGNFAAFFAGTCPGAYDSIMQNIPTTIGDSYNFTFFVNDTNMKNSVSDFQAFWNGALVQDIPGAGTGMYTQYSFTETANSTTTPIAFQGYNQPADYFLDDVSVNDLGVASVPEPRTTLLLGLGLGLILIRRLKFRTA